MNAFFILILSIIFTFFGENLIKEPIFPLQETGMQNFLIFCLIVLALSLAGIAFFVRREYRGARKNTIKFIPFIRQVLFKTPSFIKTHAEDKRPPYLFLTLFLAGASGILGSLNGAHFLYYGGVNSWFSVWAIVIIFGLMHGYIRYVLVGLFYQVGVWFSGGGFKGLLSSRNIAHYAMVPFFLVSVLTKTVEMFVYGEAYFVSPTYRWLNVLMLILVMAAGLYSVILLYWAARHLKNTKKWRSILFFVAVPLLLLFVARGPSFGEAFDPMTQSLDYNNQGIAYMNEGNMDGAEQSFKKAVESLDPANKQEMSTAYVNLAIIAQGKGDQETATDNFKKALTFLSEKDAQYFGIMGVLKIIDGDVQGAIGFLNQALTIDPKNYTALNYLGLIYLGNLGIEFRDPAKALVYNVALSKLEPNDLVGRQNLALNYFLLEKYEDALPLFEQLATVMPENALVEYFLGLTYSHLGYSEDAVIMLNKATQANPQLMTDEVRKILAQ